MYRNLLLLPILALPLLGCSSVTNMFSNPKVACPVGRVVGDAAQVTRFRAGGGMTANDVALNVTLAPPKVSCDYDPDEHTAELKAQFPITLHAGPAATTGDQDFTYFVAVVDGNTNAILSRKDYRIPLSLAGLQTAVYAEEVENLELTVARGKMPADYRVLVGFVLTPAELAYNRTPHLPNQ